MIKGFSDTIHNKAKGQKGGFLGMLWGTLGSSLLENILEGKGVLTALEGTSRVVQDF